MFLPVSEFGALAASLPLKKVMDFRVSQRFWNHAAQPPTGRRASPPARGVIACVLRLRVFPPDVAYCLLASIVTNHSNLSRSILSPACRWQPDMKVRRDYPARES